MEHRNLFQPTITNEAAAQLPIAQFRGRIRVIDTEAAIEPACRELMQQPLLGFDTETRPSFRPGPMNRVALLQLSTPDCCYLFRLCRIPLDKHILQVLCAPHILKIGADVTCDMRALHALRHFQEDGFIDLQHIIGQWGVVDRSLRKMSAIVLGERISKAQRLSNWEAVRLTPQQQLYAATDAWVCTRIYDRLLHTPKPETKDKKR